MARAKSESNGELRDAMAALVRAQAILVEANADAALRMREHEKEATELRREAARIEQETKQTFARVEAILLEHSRILHALPEAVRQKIGFRPPD